MAQDTPCPITSVDVLRDGESMVVLCTLQKAGPTAAVRESVDKSWVSTEDGGTIHGSTVDIPEDRTWWHATDIGYFCAIL